VTRQPARFTRRPIYAPEEALLRFVFGCVPSHVLTFPLSHARYPLSRPPAAKTLPPFLEKRLFLENPLTPSPAYPSAMPRPKTPRRNSLSLTPKHCLPLIYRVPVSVGFLRSSAFSPQPGPLRTALLVHLLRKNLMIRNFLKIVLLLYLQDLTSSRLLRAAGFLRPNRPDYSCTPLSYGGTVFPSFVWLRQPCLSSASICAHPCPA